MRGSGVGAPLATALAGTLNPTLVLVPVPTLVFEALARTPPLAFTQFPLVPRGRAFGCPTGRLSTPASPIPLAPLRSLGRLFVSGCRLRAIRPRLLPAMPIAIVTRTPIGGPTAGPPDLNHRRRAVRLSRCRNIRGDLGGDRIAFD